MMTDESCAPARRGTWSTRQGLNRSAEALEPGRRHPFVLSIVGVCCLTVSLALGCAAERYNVVPPGPLHSYMVRIRAGVDKLDRLMVSSPTQAEVVAVLTHIEFAAKQLTRSGVRSKHPLLRDNAVSFHSSVLRALRGAAANPPNYYSAGKVGGACIHCHDPDGGLRVE